MRKRKISNIQKKYLTYTLLLLALTILLSSVGVWQFMRKNVTEVIVDNYEFMNEKMGDYSGLSLYPVRRDYGRVYYGGRCSGKFKIQGTGRSREECSE